MMLSVCVAVLLHNVPQFIGLAPASMLTHVSLISKLCNTVQERFFVIIFDVLDHKTMMKYPIRISYRAISVWWCDVDIRLERNRESGPVSARSNHNFSP